MVEGNDSEKPCRFHNKGVNITSDSLPAELNNSGEISTPIQNLRTHVQHIINEMGPVSPHFTQNTSSEADNEESVFETTSVFSSVYKARTEVRTLLGPEKTISTDNSARDISDYSMLTSHPLIPVDDKHYAANKSKKAASVECISSRDISEFSVLPSDQMFKMEAKNACKECQENELAKEAFQYSVLPSEQLVRIDKSSISRNQQRPCCCHNGTVCFDFQPQRVHVTRREQKRKCFLSKLLFKKQKTLQMPAELYKMDVLQSKDHHSPPRKLVFDLIEGVPKPETHTIGINTHHLPTATSCTQDTISSQHFQTPSPPTLRDKSSGRKRSSYNNNDVDGYRGSCCFIPLRGVRKQKNITKATVSLDNNEAARVDVYYFDHGNSGYYETTDCLPYIMTEMLADRTEYVTTKFWAELFGTAHIGFSFFTSFVLQFFRFVLYSIVRPLTVGIVQLGSDYCFKPCLAVLFNAVVQPPLIFLYNVATTIRDLCQPLAEGIGHFLREVAVVLRAIRVVEIRKDNQYCSKKKPANPFCQTDACEIGSERSKYKKSQNCRE